MWVYSKNPWTFRKISWHFIRDPRFNQLLAIYTNLKSPGYARVFEWIAEAWDELDTNLIARSFKYCGVTTNNLADYGSQLRHFIRTSEFVDDLEESMDDEDLGFLNAGDEWDQETQDILDSRSRRGWLWKRIIILIVHFFHFI